MKRASFLNYILATVLVVIFLTPVLNRNLPRPVQISLFILYFFNLVFERGFLKWFKQNLSVVLWIIFWQGLELLYWYAGISTAASGNYLMSLFSYALIIIGLYSYHRFSNFQKLTLIFVIIGAMVYNMYDNIQINALYGGATNDIYKDWGDSYLEMNVAETGFYGAVMLLIGCLSTVLFNSYRGIINVFLAFIIILSIGFAFLITPRGIACALIILEITLIMLKTKFLSSQKIFIFAISLVAIILFIKSAAVDVEDTHGGVGRLAERVDSILDFINRGQVDDESSFGARLNLYFMSLVTWISSPISFLFGVGYHLGDYGFSMGLGQHSRYADVFANYGIVGFSILCGLTYSLYKKIKAISGLHWDLYKIICAMYILYGIVDHNRNVQMLIIIFFLLPIVDTLNTLKHSHNEKIHYPSIKHN